MAKFGHVCITVLAVASACLGQRFVYHNEEFESKEEFEAMNMFRQGFNISSVYGHNLTDVDFSNDCAKLTKEASCPHPLISFFLYAGPNGARAYINESDPNWFADSNFDTSKKTVLLIHGFGGGDDVGSLPLLRDAYIKNGSYNLINADWEVLAKWPCYLQALDNLRPVANCTAHFLANLERLSGVQPSEIDCVGFSLGAHICGIVANYISDQLGRIIALDPARPLLQSRNRNDRLDAGDAKIVQVIHTNAGFFGMTSLQGTADFCINGGRTQTPCKPQSDYNYCSHVQSLCYQAESLFPGKTRQGVPCDGRCPHGSKLKPREGDNATLGQPLETSASGMYCVSAQTPPYCQVPDSDEPDYGDPRCCASAAGTLGGGAKKTSISNYKLGERPVAEAATQDHREDVVASEEHEADPDVTSKKCIQKRIANMSCPDPHIKFYLYSGVNARKMRINAVNSSSLEWLVLNLGKPTVVLMHGYQGGENFMPTVILRDAYIKSNAYNLITVDYSVLSKERCDRVMARHNAEPVAKCTAQLFEYLAEFGVQTERTTCVGFGLGAHICGLVANFVPNRMQRIVALDPTGNRPYRRFPDKRLDPLDAEAVHVFHSDTRKYGEGGEVLGTADVCINSGRQPFCRNSINDERLCSHASSVCFFAESLFAADNGLQVEPCANRCPQPPRYPPVAGENATFGASMHSSAQGMYCLTTDAAPFCPVGRQADHGDPRCCILTKK